MFGTKLQWKAIIALSGVFIIFGVADAQPGQDLFRLYDGGNTQADLFADVYQTSNGDYLLCGQKAYHPWLIRVNYDGEILWSYEQDGARLFSVIEADNGDAVTTGIIGEDGNLGAIRVDDEGNEVWAQEYIDGRGTAIIELKDGDFMVCGTGNGGGYIIRFDGDGRRIWGRYYDCQILQSMRETEGGVVAAGHYVLGNRYGAGYVVKTNFNGDVIWEETYPLDEGQASIFFSSIVSIPNGFAIGGTGWNQYGCFSLTKINGEGELQSQSLFELSNDNYWLESINKMSDGGFILAGYVNGGQQQQYPIAVRVDQESNVLWTEDWADSVNQRQFQRNALYQLYSVIVSRDDEIVACGDMVNLDNQRMGDAWLVRFEPDRPGPFVYYTFPEDSLLQVLQDDVIQFEVRARNPSHSIITYQWFLDESALGEDSTETIRFDQIETSIVTCQVTCDDIDIQVRWHVTVTDLYVSAFTPDTLNLAIRRGASVDFSLDTIRYTDGNEPEILWTKTNLSDGQSEETGRDAGATIDFPWSGEYSVEGRVSRGESSDAVTWHVLVKGAIWAYVPLGDSLEVLPDSVVLFEVVPSAPEDESLEVQWLVDGELVREGELALDYAFGEADSSADLNRHYLVRCIVSDSVEADTVRWVVTVNDLSVGSDKEVGRVRYPVLLSVSPNPFNSTLTIRYVGGLETAGTRLGIYDIAGREVFSSVTAPNSSGKITPPTPPTIVGGDSQTFVWDASSTPAGVYFVRLQVGGVVSAKKVVLMR